MSAGRVFYRLPVLDRRRAAAALVGRTVAVRWSPCRDETVHVTVGRLLAVAVPAVGTVADLVVVETTSGYWPVAISAATVVAIEEAPSGVALGTVYAAEPEVEPVAGGSAAAR